MSGGVRPAEPAGWSESRMIKRLAAGFLAVLAAGVLSACSARTNLVVGLDTSAIPLSFTDEDGSLAGFDIDLAREIGRRAGLEIQFKKADLGEKQKNLIGGGVDCLLGMTDGSGREDLLFTRPYLKDGERFLVSSGSTIRQKSALAGKTVAVLRGSASQTALRADPIAVKLKGGTPEEYLDYYTALRDLDGLKVDAVALDQTAGQYYVTQKETQYRLLGDALPGETRYAVAVRRNDSLLRNRLQRALDEMQKDGTSRTISQKWFGTDLTLK